MILPIYEYFKRFAKDGDPTIEMPVRPANYLFAQSYEELKDRLDRLVGTFLFVDFGEIKFAQAQARNLDTTMRIAVTVAEKLSPSTLMEARLESWQMTLDTLAAIFAQIRKDVENADDYKGVFPWADMPSVMTSQMVPFVATELNAYGWTLMLDCTSPDPLKIRDRKAE